MNRGLLSVRVVWIWIAAALVYVPTLEAQNADSTLCSDRLGPSMETLLAGPEPVFTDPRGPGRTVFRRMLDLQLVDTVPPHLICRLLRKYDLLLVGTGLSAPGTIRVLTVRRASSLEELEHWEETIGRAPEVRFARLVPLSPWLVRPLAGDSGSAPRQAGPGRGSRMSGRSGRARISSTRAGVPVVPRTASDEQGSSHRAHQRRGY